MGRVIVGVDGSAPAQAALAWAADHAAARDLELVVVMVYRPSSGDNPHSVVDGGETGSHHMQQQAQLADDWRTEHDRHVHQEAEAQVRQMVKALPTRPDRVVTQTAAARRPASALIEAARDADLLVVGSRGRGGFAGLVLGSVPQQLAHHTPCPLAIIPSD